jgi:chemotaxis protein MotB
MIAALPNSIQLEGHTDSMPIHNARFASNWELSCARAIAVLETMCGTFQLSRQRFSVVGRADTVPIDSNETPEGRARNRRVDVVILNRLKVTGADDPAAAGK